MHKQIVLLILGVLILSVADLKAQPNVVWDSGGRAAVAIGGMMDEVLEQQARNRVTPTVHRKTGLRPALGEEATVKPGEVIVARLTYEASYLARPKIDFVSPRGVNVRASEMRALKMLNGKFCTVQGGEGGHCFQDLDNDKDWDGAGKARGRWVDVPYEVLELRKEIPDGDRRELVLAELGEKPIIEYREWFRGALVEKQTCHAQEARTACNGLSVTEVSRDGGSVRFLVDVQR